MEKKIRKIVVFGDGIQAELAHYYFSTDTDYEVVAFTVDKGHKKGESLCNRPVLEFEEIESMFHPSEYGMFIAIGYTKMNDIRSTKYYEAKRKGYNLVSYISSKNTIWPNVNFGDNCFIYENNTFQPFASVGNNVSIAAGNIIGHNTIIEDHCFVTSHVVVAGFCRIGEGSFLGINSTITDHLTIGKKTFVGAGTLITRNTDANSVYKTKRATAQDYTSDELWRF